MGKYSVESIVYGKIPPQCVDLEEAVLGAMMMDRDGLEMVSILSKEDFYNPCNEIIFEAIQFLHSKDRKVDLLTVTEQIRTMGKLEEVGGPYYITTLTNRVASAAHIEEHALKIKQKRFMRDIIRIGSTAVQKAYEDTTDVFELMELVERDFSEAGSSIVANNIYHISEVGAEVEKLNIEREQTKDIAIYGVPTFFEGIDDVGLPQKGDLVVWAARASMGKTSAMLSAALRQAKQGIRVGIMSMEMSRAQIFNRLLCHETGIPFKRIASNELVDFDRSKVERAKIDLYRLPIYIEDAPNQTLSQFKTKATRMKRKFGVDVVYADHLGKLKIQAFEQNTYLMVTEIVRGVKSLARTLEIPIILLVQLSRKVEGQKDMRPMLSHLRDSGAIEEEADQVALFYRPEYYHKQGLKGFDTVMVDGEVINSEGYAEMNYAKNRNGEAKIVKLKYIGYRMAFDDWDATQKRLVPIEDVIDTPY